MSEPTIAKLFTTGGSQAVRLPKEFRFSGDAVRIRREGDAVILEPIEKPGWPEGFWERFEKLPPLSDDFEIPESLPQPIGERDLVIASVGLANGATLVAGNVREFGRVPGLRVEDWASADRRGL